VVATRDIKAMEIILEDTPAVSGPTYESRAVCLECLGPVDGSTLCSHCNLPLCSDACRDGPNHQPECQVFAKLTSKVSIEQFTGPEPLYGCITGIRLLNLKETQPETWNRLDMLMDHDKERRTELEYWNIIQSSIVDYVLEDLHLSSTYSEAEVLRAVGLLRTNALYQPHTKGNVLYTTFSFLSHCCTSNANYTVAKDDSLILRAQRDIPCGEEITIQYISFLHGNSKRRKDIRSNWFFRCLCTRCEDTTELGTFLSATLCLECSGPVLPQTNDIDVENWTCGDCKAQVKTSKVEELLNKCENDIKDTVENDIEGFERLFEKYSKKLHTNHYLLLSIRKKLSQAFTRKGETQVPRQTLENRMKLAEQYIAVYTTLDPGHTKWRSMLLYEVVKVRLVLNNNKFSQGEMEKEAFVEGMEADVKDLDYVVSCLENEPEDSKAKMMAHDAIQTLSQARECLQFTNFF